jgi:peptidoglycan hydrolase CwlO-like protein
MKGKTIKKWVQKPLRFHHQDIHEELEEIKGLIGYVSGQMQELRDRVDRINENTSLWLSKQNGTEGE